MAVTTSISDAVTRERAALVQLLEEVGPEAPTLPSTWRAADLAHHLAIQDLLSGVTSFVARRVVLATGWRTTVLYRNRPRLAALRSGRRSTWTRDLERLRGPHASLLMREPIAPIALWEHVVHHEDVRRPAGAPRGETPSLERVLEWLLRYNAAAIDTYRVAIETPAVELHPQTDERVRVSGPELEVVMWLSGRSAGAEVTVSGDAAAIRSVEAALVI